MAAGLLHTKNDKEVGWDEIQESQKELNGHTSMLIKCFKSGAYWKHGERVSETVMRNGQSLCPLTLLYKDHKRWIPGMGTTPPTRPVAGGHLGLNMQLSEIVSDLLDPIVATYKGGKEIISTEDMLARVVILNEMSASWSRRSFWRGLICGEYRACQLCEGTEEYVWDEEDPELYVCEEWDG